MKFRLFYILFALFCTAGSTASAVTPVWAYTNYPCRVLFTFPYGTNGFALLPFYHTDLGFEPDAFRVAGPPPANAPLAWRLLGKSSDRTLVLVQLDQPYSQTIQLLAYAAPSSVARKDENPALEPRLPISASFYSSRSRAVPDTLPRFLYMLQSASRQDRTFPVSEFPASLPQSDKPSLIQLQTYILCPLSGPYAFRASGVTPLFGFINGLSLSNGQAIVSGPDCVPVRLMTASPGGTSGLTLEWQPPGAPAFQPIPHSAYAGPSLAIPRKTERLDRTLQPQFEAELRPPYGFRDMPGPFYPLTLRDRSENWLPHPLTRRWRFANGEFSTEAESSLTLTNTEPQNVTLLLSDELGFTNALTHAIAWGPSVPTLYQLAAVPFPAPAACFRADVLEPALMTQGDWPTSLDVLLTVRLLRLGGDEQTQTFTIPPTHSPHVTRMAACLASDFDSLTWSVSHLGVVLTNGVTAALQTPFPTRPVHLAGDRLEDDAGRRLIYVVPRLSTSNSAPTASPNSPILLIDDFITARAAPEASGTPTGFAVLLKEALGEPVRVLPLTDWRNPGDVWKPLLKMVEVPELAGSTPARVLLAIGGQDCATGIPPEEFERQATALCDLLLQAGHAVTWVTPPPFPERPDKARLYAMTIRRIAESRRLPVADLYSLFAGAETGGQALFDDLLPACLSAQGRKLAAERIAEQIRPRPKGGESLVP